MMMRKGYALAMVAAGLFGTASFAQEVRTPAQIAAALAAGGEDQAAAATASEEEEMIVGEERSFALAKGMRAGTVRSPAAAHPAVRRQYGAVASRAKITPGADVRRTALDMQLTFANGSAELDAEAKRRIDPFAAALTRPDLGLAANTFRVEGHTNSVGALGGNLDLSRRRAQAVVVYLVSKGVPATRLSGQGFGPDRPLPGARRDDGANRRVEIVRN